MDAINNKGKPSETAGMYNYRHATDGGVLNCFLDYQPADTGCEASMSLCFALANGMDVAGLLSPEKQQAIEAAALEELEKVQRDADEDFSIDRYRARMEDMDCIANGWIA